MSDPLEILIPTLGRPDALIDHPMLTMATVAIHESEVDKYEAKFRLFERRPRRVVIHRAHGISATRNVLLSEVERPDLHAVFMDDDFEYMNPMMTFRHQPTKDPEYITAVLCNTRRMALDAGIPIFGYAQTMRPMERTALFPFLFRRWVNAASMGFRADSGIQFDTNLVAFDDIDVNIQCFQRYRMVLSDQRYGFNYKRWTRGGMASSRTQQAIDESYEYMKQKWGTSIIEANPGRRASGFAMRINVT